MSQRQLQQTEQVQLVSLLSLKTYLPLLDISDVCRISITVPDSAVLTVPYCLI